MMNKLLPGKQRPAFGTTPLEHLLLSLQLPSRLGQGGGDEAATEDEKKLEKLYGVYAAPAMRQRYGGGESSLSDYRLVVMEMVFAEHGNERGARSPMDLEALGKWFEAVCPNSPVRASSKARFTGGWTDAMNLTSGGGGGQAAIKQVHTMWDALCEANPHVRLPVAQALHRALTTATSTAAIAAGLRAAAWPRPADLTAHYAPRTVAGGGGDAAARTAVKSDVPALGADIAFCMHRLCDHFAAAPTPLAPLDPKAALHRNLGASFAFHVGERGKRAVCCGVRYDVLFDMADVLDATLERYVPAASSSSSAASGGAAPRRSPPDAVALAAVFFVLDRWCKNSADPQKTGAELNADKSSLFPSLSELRATETAVELKYRDNDALLRVSLADEIGPFLAALLKGETKPPPPGPAKPSAASSSSGPAPASAPAPTPVPVRAPPPPPAAPSSSSSPISSSIPPQPPAPPPSAAAAPKKSSA